MLARFSLYGFLKNQRYFEPFLVLYFLDQGLSFTAIGLLVAVRELSANLLEIPSGAAADIYGRRRAMIGSFVAYILSFLVFALGRGFAWFALAMVFYACGDAFRTGTHKAMIFTWLRAENRLDEKTRVYGFTRSWSKLGSALSIVIATILMIWLDDYRWIFLLSIVPYALGIINFLRYPAWLDGEGSTEVCQRDVLCHLRTTLRQVVGTVELRRLVAESMTFEGTFKVVKDYLQPVTRQAALAVPVLVGLEAGKREALLVGVVYLGLYLLSAWGSRQSHRLSARCGGEENGVQVIWWGSLVAYGAMGGLLFTGHMIWALMVFLGLALLQNVFRPMHVSRFDAHAGEEQGATVLSVESQAKNVAAMVLAPVLGLIVDQLTGQGPQTFWPVAAVGFGLAALMIATRPRAVR